MKVWVTRDGGKNHHANRTSFWKQKPNKHTCVDGFYYYGSVVDEIFPDIATKDFKSLYRFTPRKGSCKQMELSLTEIR